MQRHRWRQLSYRRLTRVSMILGGTLLLIAGGILTLTLHRQHVVIVDIATDPPDAVVEIDGLTIGRTPLRMLLPEGPHQLVISREGFKVIDRKIYADPSAPPKNNRYAFGLIPTGETLSAAEKSRRIESLQRRAEEAFKRGDYVAPEHDNAWYYLNKLQELDPTNPFIMEMRQRIRRVLKQQAEMTRPHNDLA